MLIVQFAPQKPGKIIKMIAAIAVILFIRIAYSAKVSALKHIYKKRFSVIVTR
jgi:hypothetical protein